MSVVLDSKENLLESACSILVCFVNTEGKDNESTRLFNKKFPRSVSTYKSICKADHFEEFGKVLVLEDAIPLSLEDKINLICFLPSTIKYVEEDTLNMFSDLLLNAGLNSLYRICRKADINSIGFYYSNQNGDSMPLSILLRSIENQFLNSTEDTFELVIYH